MSQDERKTSRLIELDSVVHNVLNDLGDYNHDQFLRYKQWAIRGFKAIGLHVLPTIEIDYFTVDSNNIVNLPDDYIRYTRIGVIRDSRIWTLTEDPTIPITRDEANGSIAQYADLEDAEVIPELTTWYSAPAVAYNLAFHRYDRERNRLIFSGDMIGESVVVEYVSTGVNERGRVLAPVEAEEALIAWVHKQRTLNDKKATESDKERRDREFMRTMIDLVDFLNAFTLDDLVDAINANSSQLTKR